MIAQYSTLATQCNISDSAVGVVAEGNTQHLPKFRPFHAHCTTQNGSKPMDFTDLWIASFAKPLSGALDAHDVHQK